MDIKRKEMWKKIHTMRRVSCVLGLWAVCMTVGVIHNINSDEVNTVIDSVTPTAELMSTGVAEVYTATAYCPCKRCCGKTDGITATGTKAIAGRTIAVDPRKIPLGSTVFIDGQPYIAEDIGGAVKGNRVDIFFNSHIEALRFGRRTVSVTVAKGV